MGKKVDLNMKPLSLDQLTEMSLQELTQKIHRYKRLIKEAMAAGKDTRHLEIEICYLQNEKGQRHYETE